MPAAPEIIASNEKEGWALNGQTNREANGMIHFDVKREHLDAGIDSSVLHLRLRT